MTHKRRLKYLRRLVHGLARSLRRVCRATRIAEKTHAEKHEVAALRERRQRHTKQLHRAEQELRAEEERT